jgi:predicted flap endonuclease-1-like 5' DNA nuclease
MDWGTIAWKIFWCLLLAFILGFIIGWLLKSLFCKGRSANYAGDYDASAGQSASFKSSSSAAASVATAAVDTGWNDEYAGIKARLDELEVLATDDEEDTDEELAAWTAETEALKSKIARLKGKASGDNAARAAGLDGDADTLLAILAKARADKAAGIAKVRRQGYGKGIRDDLKDIVGVGPVLEKVLNGHDIWTFKQIATMGDSAIDDLADKLGSFQGPRVRREDWVGQCRQLHQQNYGESV